MTIEEILGEILQYLNNADEVLVKSTPQDKKTYIRQFVAGITILPKKKEGIVGFYSFPQIDEVSNQLNKSKVSVIMDAEGGSRLKGSFVCLCKAVVGCGYLRNFIIYIRLSLFICFYLFG